MNQRICDDLTGRQQWHCIICHAVPITRDHLPRFDVLRNPFQDIIQDHGQRPRKITTVNGPHIVGTFDRGRDGEVRQKTLRILAQSVEPGNRQLSTLTVGNNAREVKDRFITVIDEAWGSFTDRG